MKKAEKLTIELGSNEVPKVTKEFTKKHQEWLSTFPSTPKDSKLATEKLDNIRGALDEDYANPIQSTNRLKNPELGNTFKMPESKKKESNKFLARAKESMSKWGKRIMLTVGLSAISMGAKGEAPNREEAFADSAQNKTEKVTGAIRKVKESEVTKDYTFSHKDGEKKVYKRALQGGSSNLEMAQPSTSKGGPGYEKKIINLLKSGIGTQELVDKNYGTFEGIEKIRKDNKIEYIDYVYTEPEKEKVKEVDPYAAYAVVGNAVYHNGVSGHNTGQMYYLSMHSKNIQEGGMTDTGNEDFVIRLQDGNGKPILKDSKGNLVPGGLAVKIKAGDKNKYMNGAGRLEPGAYEKLVKLAEEQRELNKDKQEIQQIGPDFTTKADTVGLPGTDIAKNK